MSDFIKTFKLKQHTPLIHFQHDQDGATLRATELKPKIDAWIIRQKTGIDLKKNRGKEAFEKAQKEVIAKLLESNPEWLVGGGKAQHPAFDYKLHIRAGKGQSYLVASNIARNMQEEYDRLKIPYLAGVPYFADNEPIKNRQLARAKRGIMYEDIHVEIVCFDDSLMAEVENALPYVFAYNNFGVRQSKGFGCFSLAYETVDDFEDLLREHPRYEKSFVYRFEGRFTPNLQKILGKIDGEYKILKSGFARDRSQMMEYFDEKGIEWEKPILKKELVLNKSLPAKNDYSNDPKRKYVRALLGVAELYEFPRDQEKIKITCAEDDQESDGTLVERFRSPITFKVFDNNIYMMPEAIPEEIWGRKFTFTNERKVSITLETPAKGSFDLDEFLENHRENTWDYV